MVVCARACDDQAFVVLSFFWCWLVVGALLGVWDDTLVVVPVYRLLRAVGGLLCGGLFCGVWVLCENWIVDASILFFCKFDCLTVFLL